MQGALGAHTLLQLLSNFLALTVCQVICQESRRWRWILGHPPMGRSQSWGTPRVCMAEGALGPRLVRPHGLSNARNLALQPGLLRP